MSRTTIRRQGAALLLNLPLVAFLAAFFLWPLVSIFTSAVSDSAVHDIFPSLHQAAIGWDGETPTKAMQQALTDDILAANDQQAYGDAVRRLNADRSGLRTLMSKTRSALVANPTAELVTIDPRWSDVANWRTIVANLPKLTDRFVLAAGDRRRNAAGDIERTPPDSSLHVEVLLRTLSIAGLVTALCVAIGLPYSLVMVTVSAVARQFLLAAVLIPLWTSVLVRVTAWFIVLQTQGVLNDMLILTGLSDEPLQLLFSRTGVVIAMVHVMLPFMILPIFSVLTSVPSNLVPAALSLGATPWRAIWYVLLPLSLRGVATGSLLVFMTSLGFYILPALIGGPKDQLVSSLVADYAIANANWSMASALAILLLITTLAIHFFYRRFSGEARS